MAEERIRFRGDPEPGNTVEPVAGVKSQENPQIPLEQRVQPTKVQMLDQSKAGEDIGNLNEDDEDDGSDGPQYSRENVSVSSADGLETSRAIAEHEKQLDTEDVVPMMFRVPVNLQHMGIMHHWGPGIHNVPISLAGVPKDPKRKMHWWLKAHKVKYAGMPIKNPHEPPPEEPDEATEAELAAMGKK